MDWVLELGCGSGRIGRSVSLEVKNFVGLDIDWDSVRIASENGVLCYCADMKNFQLSCQFDRIIIPCNTMYCLLSEKYLVSCLKNIRKHLKKNGQVIFDVFVSYDTRKMSHSNKSQADNGWVKEIYYKGYIWDVYERVEMVQGAERVDVYYSHKCRFSDEEIETKIPQCYFSYQDVPQLLDRAGLTLKAMEGGFRSEPISDSCDRVVVRATPSR